MRIGAVEPNTFICGSWANHPQRSKQRSLPTSGIRAFSTEGYDNKGYTRRARNLRRERIQREIQMANAKDTLEAFYEKGRNRLLRAQVLSQEDAEKFKRIDDRLIKLQFDHEELEWYGKDKFTRDYLQARFALKAPEGAEEEDAS